MTQRAVAIWLVLDLAQPACRLHRRRRVHMVQQRRRPGEPLVPHELFCVQSAVRLTEHGVAFARDLPESVIDRHYRFPRAACSRSIASKSALKFPAPKLFAPFR